MLQHKKFAIISPCKNEGENLEGFINEINNLTGVVGNNFTLLIIDDGSNDNTWRILEEEKQKYNFLKAIRLSKNFGKEAALDAGLNYIGDEFDFYITIDADLQHPVHKIPELIENFVDVEIVNTHRVDLKEGFFRETFSKIFYKILYKFTEIKIISKTTDFMLISKRVRNEFIKINEIDKTYRILIYWLGFTRKSIPIKIKNREKGTSKYNFFNLSRLAVSTISSFSIFPIRIIGYVGLAMSIIAASILIFFIINYFLNLTVFSWQTQFIILQILLSGLTMMSVSLVGLYISKIQKNVNTRPNYIIEKKI